MEQRDNIKKGAKFVTVFSALPSDHEFNLKDGRVVTINGQPQSIFVGENAIPYQGNQFGKTTGIKVEDWEEVRKVYGSLEMMKNNVIFAASTESEAKGKKKELETLETGLEQIDPKDTKKKDPKKKVKTKPADKDEDK